MFERNQTVQFLVDPDTGSIIDANPAACAYYGYSRAEMRTLRNTDLSGQLPIRVLADMQQAKIRPTETFRSKHRLANGEVRDVEVTLSTFEAGGRTLLHAVVSDVTERTRAEQLLRIQYELSEALVATSDLTEALHLALNAALQVKGVDCGGIYLVDKRTGALDLAVHRGLSPQFIAYAQHYAPGSARARMVYNGSPIYERWTELRIPTELATQEGLRSLVAVPVLRGGHLLCVLNAASRSVDEFPPAARTALEALASQVGSALARIQAEGTLQATDEQLRLAVAGADLGTWDWDVQTDEVTFNQRWIQMLGYTTGEIGQYLRFLKALIHPDDVSRVLQAMEAHLAGQTPSFECEHRMQHKAGHWVWVLSRGRVIERAADGRPVRACGTHLDVTQRHEAETLLRQQAGLLDLTQDAIMVLDFPDVAIRYWNRGAAAHYGYTAEEAIGKSATDLLRTVFPEPLEAILSKFADAGHWEGELVQTRRDGTQITVASHWAVRRDPDGNPIDLLEINQDISERKQAEMALRESEEALRQSEERYRSVVAAMAEGLVLQQADGRVLAANASAGRIMGLSPEQLLGRARLDPEWRAIHEDGSPFPVEEHPARSTLRTGRPLRDAIMGVYKPDGTLTWVSINTEPLFREGETTPYAAVASITNITRRKQAEIEREAAVAELAEREATLRGLVTASSDGILMTDEVGTLIEWNPALERITGLRRTEMVGRPVWEVQFMLMAPERRSPALLESVQEIVAGLLYDGQTSVLDRTYEVQIHRPGGEQRIVQFVNFGVPTPGGVRLASIVRDVTEQRREAQMLVQRQRLESIGVLAGGIAHDFNNISQVVLGQTELALHKLEPAHPARRHVAKIVEPVERAAELTRQLLAYAGLGKYSAESMDLGQIVRDSESLIRAALQKGATVRLDLATDLPPIRADRAQVQQALMSLVVNAGEALDTDQGTVSIATGSRTVLAGEQTAFVAGAVPQPGSYVSLQVADTGTGMDANTLARVFDPFFSTRFTGRGLGLPAVLGIVRAHAGGLILESQPGKGTVVTLLWPAAEAIPVAAPRPLAAAASQGAGRVPKPPRRGTVLVVDDEETIREALIDVLALSDIPVLIAENGQQAIAVFQERHAEIGLVLLDVLMPIMNGGAALRELRALDPAVPVVLATGYDDREIERRLAEWKIDERPDGILQKPFGISDVLGIAERYLQA